MIVLSIVIALAASVIGGICGIGGGVLMKPLFDLIGIASVSTASFLSGITVLSMSGYNTVKNLTEDGNAIDIKTMVPLSIGAATGGIIGKLLFESIKKSLPNADAIGAVQAIVLGILTVGTILYTIYKRHIKTKHIENKVLISGMGLILGVLSSFLGIGGGPFNIPFLLYFFTMDSKTAAQNSLFIILFSQLFSLIYTIVSKSVPPFDTAVLISMIIAGIAGGVIGKSICKKINNETVDKLFIALLTVICFICAINFYKFIG